MRLLVATLISLWSAPAAVVLGQTFDYAGALAQSLLFFEAQRSGPLPADNRVDWRADSGLDDFIVGGYYDAGDHVKFGFPMASTVTQLAYGAITFKAGYESADQSEHILDCIKWGTDYFVAAHTAEFELYGQIGDAEDDHAYWGRPEDMTMPRPAFKIDAENPGSELAGETAAALAAASVYYATVGETALAEEALAHARQLFDFADTYRGVYTDAIPAGGYYDSWSGYNDELAWSAAWLHKATGEADYLAKAEAFYDEFGLAYWPPDFGWDNKVSGVKVLLYEATGSDKYLSAVNADIDHMLNVAQRTPLGLVFLSEWGSLRAAANMVHVMLQAGALGIRSSEVESFAYSQIDYMLGSTGRSFVVGFGVDPPQRPHHRASSCPDMPEECTVDHLYTSEPNPQTLSGALVGGPNANDEYVDDRQDYVHNEVADDYNAGFQSALAALVQLTAQSKRETS